MLDWNEYRKELAGRMGEFFELSPGTMEGYKALSGAGRKTGHLDAKTRELIAIAVGVTTRCDGCIAVHTKAAKAAGAEVVGFDDLAAQVKAGNLNFDVVIATPDAMKIVGQLGQILGPRGLMPNPKVGTVTMDVTTAVGNAKAGQVQYRTDKGGIVHSTIGRASFAPEKLQENLKALVDALVKAKPAASKGQYLRKIAVSSTMGPGIRVDAATL